MWAAKKGGRGSGTGKGKNGKGGRGAGGYGGSGYGGYGNWHGYGGYGNWQNTGGWQDKGKQKGKKGGHWHGKGKGGYGKAPAPDSASALEEKKAQLKRLQDEYNEMKNGAAGSDDKAYWAAYEDDYYTEYPRQRAGLICQVGPSRGGCSPDATQCTAATAGLPRKKLRPRSKAQLMNGQIFVLYSSTQL